MTRKPLKPKDKQTLVRVRAAFILKGTSFHAYCVDNGIDRSNAVRALTGTWKGKKGKALKSKIIQDSKSIPE